MCSTSRRDLPHSTPFPLQFGWIADCGVDYVINRTRIVVDFAFAIRHANISVQYKLVHVHYRILGCNALCSLSELLCMYLISFSFIMYKLKAE